MFSCSCLSHISETRPSEMTKDEAQSSSVSEGRITNMAYLNQGEEKEEKEEGKGKGQEGWHLVQRWRFDTFGVSI